MNTSETVQAAQRLLAERERFGLVKYGTTVDRTDLQAGDWLQHGIEEASDLLLYLIRLRETMRKGAEFRLHRKAVARGLIPESRPAPAPAAAPEDAERRFGPITSDPADAERNIRAKEDAERAAYLERWKDAPEWATHLAQDWNGACVWFDREPFLVGPEESHEVWVTSNGEIASVTTMNILGSVRCEPRPVQGVGP